jgi:N-methylhydantoinase A/oxoprolinase/acetone carboxylase beta subunit
MSSPKDQSLITALLTEPTVELAAKKAKVSTRTAFYRLKDPEFKKELNARRRDLMDTAIARLQKSADRAISALIRNLSHAHRYSAHEIAAAKIILEMGQSGLAWSDMTDRIGELEKLLTETVENEKTDRDQY